MPRRFSAGANASANDFDLIAQHYPPKIPVDFDALADMASGLVDGGIILSRVLKDKELLPKQVILYRDFVRAVFLGAGEERGSNLL